MLWSAIAEEMLSNPEARLAGEKFEADQPQRATRQRRANNPQQAPAAQGRECRERDVFL